MGEQECHVHKTLDTEVVGEENVYFSLHLSTAQCTAKWYLE